jgi:hypothetical protein
MIDLRGNSPGPNRPILPGRAYLARWGLIYLAIAFGIGSAILTGLTLLHLWGVV